MDTGLPLLVPGLAQLPLTKWNRIKAELIEMWQIIVSANYVYSVTV